MISDGGELSQAVDPPRDGKLPSTGAAYGTIRNEAAFHLDRNLVSKGLSRLARKSPGKIAIFSGDDEKARTRHGTLAGEVLLHGLQARVRNTVNRFIRRLPKLLNVHDPLDRELLRILGKLGLKPIVMHSAGAPAFIRS